MENLKSLLSIFAQEEPVLQKLLQEGEVEKLAEYMKADKAGKIVYAEAFRARPLEKRRALAYIYGILLLNPEYGSPSNKFITNMFPQAAIDWPPFVNRGSVGPSGMWTVSGIRVFHEYLERNPAESHCPAGGDFCGFGTEAGRGNGTFGSVPVRFSDLVRYEADGVFCLERHQDYGGKYRIHTA